MNLKQRVQLTGTYSRTEKGLEAPTGTIVGMGHLFRDNKTQAIYLVELDQGFYSEDRTIWVSVLTVDRNALLPID